VCLRNANFEVEDALAKRIEYGEEVEKKLQPENSSAYTLLFFEFWGS
jgi:hypothetical protein